MEKKATSEPDTSPEQMIRNTNPITGNKISGERVDVRAMIAKAQLYGSPFKTSNLACKLFYKALKGQVISWFLFLFGGRRRFLITGIFLGAFPGGAFL